MKTSILVFSVLSLGSIVAGVPLRKKRDDVEWVTEIEVVTEYVEVTSTVWIDDLPTATPEASPSAFFYESGPQTSATPQTVGVTTSTSSTSSTSSIRSTSSTSSTPSTTAAPVVVPSPQPVKSVPAPVPEPVASSQAAPVPSAPAYEAPVSLPSPAASTPSAPAAAPAPVLQASTGGEVYTGGDLTYYEPNGGYGSCGITISNDDNVVALPHGLMDAVSAVSNGHPWCGKKIVIYFGDKQYTAIVQDKCMGCTGNDLDLAKGFFDKVTGGKVDGRGKGQAKWSFVG